MNLNRFWQIGLVSIFLFSCGAVKEHKSNSSPIEHSDFDELLNSYVSVEGNVNYEGFLEKRAKFDSYLDKLKTNHPNKKKWSKDEQLAYWINAYNAFTLEIILDNYPVRSIKDIKNGIPFVNTVWDIKFINIEGAEYDLNNIEHGIIRKQFDEPRIHFAVNCASFSCPKLRNEAYTATRIEEQLEDQAKYFVNNLDKNRIDENELELSKIFLWYGGDFKKNGAKVIDFISKYSDININKEAKINYLDYKWTLNE